MHECRERDEPRISVHLSHVCHYNVNQDKQLRGTDQSPLLPADAPPLPVNIIVWDKPGSAQCVSKAERAVCPTVLPWSLYPVQVTQNNTQHRHNHIILESMSSTGTLSQHRTQTQPHSPGVYTLYRYSDPVRTTETHNHIVVGSSQHRYPDPTQHKQKVVIELPSPNILRHNCAALKYNTTNSETQHTVLPWTVSPGF